VQNVEFLNVKAGGIYSDHWALEGQMSVITTSLLMLYRKKIAVCSQIHTKHINTLCGQNVEFLNVKAGGIYSDHLALDGQMSVITTTQLMLYREIIAVCSQIHTKHIKTLCG